MYRRLIAAAAAAFLSLALLIATATVGRADPSPGGAGEVCVNGVCTVTVTQPGGGGGGNGGGNGSGGGGGGGCTWKGQNYPCSDVRFGYFSNGCYYKPASPPPAPDEPVWASVGHKPSDNGAIYSVMCLPLNGRGAASAWFATPPAGPPPPPPAVTLAQRALAKLKLTTFTARSSEDPRDHAVFVGVPVTLWVAGAWQAKTATAAVPTRAVTLVATPVGVSWDMGDADAMRRSGARPDEIGPKYCDGPGLPFSAQRATNPPCGYTYQVSSAYSPQEGPRPNDRFFHPAPRVIYKLHWTCARSCDEPAGDLPDQRVATTPMPLRVFEIQTVVVPNPPSHTR